MTEFGPKVSADDVKIEWFEGIGEITVGGTSSNWYLLLVALCIQNNPQLNKFLLLNKLKITDRITKTKIFPRKGMALPDGETYEEPEEEETPALEYELEATEN
jgi:hypothetical protein